MDIFKVVRKNNVELLKEVINIDENLLYIKDSFGSNLLHKAIFWKCNEIVKYLIDTEKLRDENDNDGYTVYHKAALADNQEAIRLLGASKTLNIRNKANELAIATAIKTNHKNIFENLMELLDYKDIAGLFNITDISSPSIIYYINKKIKVDEPVMLYPRDDLTDPYSLEDIIPGVLYAIRPDGRGGHYCLGTSETVDTMIKTKYKSTHENMVFDMVQNQTVPIDSISFCIKNDCPEVVRKIYDKTFTEKDIDLAFKDEKYNNYDQLFFANKYKNEEAVNLIELAMKM